MDARDVARKALGMQVAAPMLTPEQEAALSAPVAPTVGAPTATIGPLSGNFEPQAPQRRALPFAPAPQVGGGPSINVDLSGVTESHSGAVARAPSLADMGPPRQGPPIIAPQYRPGGWVPGSETKQFEYGMAPEELDAAAQRYKTAITHAENAADAGYRAAEFKAKNDAYYQATRQAEEQKYAQERAALLAAKQAKIDESLADLQKRSEAVANAKVDPAAFWGEGAQGGLARVLGAIAVGMGQYSSSRIGGPNTALNIINSAIDRNIAAQRDNIDNQKAGLQAKNSLYAQNLAAFGDKESALLATKINYLEQAKAFMEQQAALNEGSARAMENKENMLAKADNQIGDLNLKLAQLGHTREAMSSSRHYQPGGMVGGGAAKPEDRLVTLPDGTSYLARSDKEAEAARGLESGYEQVKSLADEAARTRKETGILDHALKLLGYDTEKIAKLKSLNPALTAAYKTQKNLGTVDAGVERMANAQFGDQSALFGNQDAKLQTYLEQAGKEREFARNAAATQVRRQALQMLPNGTIGETSIGQAQLNKVPKTIKTNKIGAK